MVTKVTVILLAVAISVSMFVAGVLHRLNTDTDRNNVFVPDQSTVLNDRLVTLDDRTDNLFWFVQVSDTHFNFYNDRNRVADLQHFCAHLLPTVNPPALVLTGDITDSRSPDPMGSDQYLPEWQAYNETRIKCLSQNPNITWLDIRGNHDNFNVHKSWNEYYKNFTVQASMSKEGRSYRSEVIGPNGNTYSFIGMDACIIPGIKRPFNFVGQVSADDLKRIKLLRKQSENSTYTVWFGHYPTSAISNSDDVRSIINGPYLCGHYHNFHGLAPRMYSTQSQGYLEAELCDWKQNRMFRIGVIDGGLFTFNDFQYDSNPDHPHQDAPLIVVSNPRSVLYQMESLEPFWRTIRSTHIRVLVFSRRPLIQVTACITNHQKVTKHDCLESMQLRHVSGALWVAPWTPKTYRKGLYYITITASNDHDTSEVTSPFSFDQTKPQFSLSSRISLRISFQSMGLFFFSVGLLLSIVPLVVFRVFTFSDNSYFRYMFNLSRRSYTRKIFFKLYILSHINKLFFPLIFVPIYMSFGPWLVGNFVADSFGVVFLWGTYIEGQFLPVSFTYIFAGIFLFIFHIPFIGSLAFLSSSRCLKSAAKVQFFSSDVSDVLDSDSSEKSQKNSSLCDFDYLNIFFIICIIILEGMMSTMYYFAYGYWAMATNFFVWTCLLNVILLVFALRLTKDDFKHWL